MGFVRSKVVDIEKRSLSVVVDSRVYRHRVDCAQLLLRAVGGSCG